MGGGTGEIAESEGATRGGGVSEMGLGENEGLVEGGLVEMVGKEGNGQMRKELLEGMLEGESGDSGMSAVFNEREKTKKMLMFYLEGEGREGFAGGEQGKMLRVEN